MAGSRVHKYKSILKRAEGLLKSNAIKWEDRPIWYDVMKRFPPRVNPHFERPEPTESVRKIFYPEDLIRAKYYQEFGDRDIVNLKVEREDVRLKSQVFVETYLKHKKPGMTVDEIVTAAENEMHEDPRFRLIRTKAQTSTLPNPDEADIEVDSKQSTEKKTKASNARKLR